MPLANKYLKYSPEITLEIFKLVWDKFEQSGYDLSSGINTIFKNWKTWIYIIIEDNGICTTNRRISNLLETTVQEILGYDPFVNGDDFVLPEKWCCKITDESIEIFNNWRISMSKYYLQNKIDKKYPYITSNGSCNYTTMGIEITFNQFKKYVLKQEVEKGKEVVPEYVECIEVATQNTKIGEIFKCRHRNGLFEFEYNDKSNTSYNSWDGWGSSWENEITQKYFKPSTKEAFDAQNKPKPIEDKRFFVALQNKLISHGGASVTIGRIYKANSNQFAFYDDNGNWICFLSNEANIKWFATEAEAEEFAKTLVEPGKEKMKFKVGKWYKNLGKNSSENTFGKFLDLRNNDKEFWMSEYIYKGKFAKMQGWLDYSSETIEIDIKEIQQYLPDDHPDKITPVIQQVKDIQKANQEFKVGDWVYFTGKGKSIKTNTWYVGKIDQIKHITKNSLIFNNASNYKDGFRHATPEEITNHLISTQIPAGEPLNTGIEPNKDGMFKYTIVGGNSFNGECSTSITRTVEIIKPATIEFNYLPEPK